MKSYFRILSALSAVAAVIAFSGCGGKEQEQPKPDPVKVSGVSIDKPTLSMTEGETANLTAIVMPENATNKAVAWKSGNSGVADVDASGKVTAVKAGTTDITVTTADGGKTAICKVTVTAKSVPATGLTLSPESLVFIEGQTKSINATVAPSNTTDEVVWPSPAQLTSNGGGSYTAKKADDSESFDLEVKAGAVSAKAGVTVYPMWFVEFLTDKLVPDGSTSTITEGGELTCYFSKKKTGITGDFYIGNDILPAGDFTVSSSEAGIATVEKVVVSSKYNGFKVVGKKLGSSTITVKIGDVSRSIKVTVTEKTVPATGLTLAPKSLELVEGQTKSINATVTPSNTTDEVVWPSSSYLTSNGGGTYTAKKADDSESFDLEVKAGAASAKAGVMVYPMWFVHFSKNKYELVPDGSTYELDKNKMIACYFSKKKSYATHEDRIDRDILSEGDFTVTSSDNSVATVRKSTVGAGGRIYHGFDVSALNVGSSTITVKIGNVSRSFKVTVTEKTIPATGLTIDQKLTFVEGQTKRFTATVTPSNSTDQVVWANRNEDLINNGGGSYTAKKRDRSLGFYLEAKAGSATAQSWVFIYPMWLVNHKYGTIIPYGSTNKITKGGKIVCFFSKKNGNVTSESDYIGRDILPGTDFTIGTSNKGVAHAARVSTSDDRCSGFVVFTEEVGTATITVKIGNVSRSFKVTVVEKTVPATGLDVTPRNLTFVEGQTKSFSATVTPSNSTDNVVWPNSSYLTSNGGGTYTANKLGFDNYVGFELDVKAGSVTKKAGVMVYPMWFAELHDRKYTLIPDGSTYKLDKNKSITCYFSKRNFSITDNDIIDKRILPKGDFTVTSSNNSVASVRKETMGGGEWNGFSVSALNAGRSTITVKIGSVSRSFDVLVRVPATGITLNPTSLFFVEGQTKSFSATVTPSNSTDEVVWSNHSLFENKGGGTYTAERATKIINEQITVKAGSVSVKADVTVCPMYFFGYYTKKPHYSAASSDNVVLKKGEKAFICFSKTGKYKSKADLVERSVLSPTEIKVFDTGWPLVAVRVVTYENKYPGIEIEALKDNDSKLVKVKIGNVEKNIFVYVKK
mgnify:CR=1 FL=1